MSPTTHLASVPVPASASQYRHAGGVYPGWDGGWDGYSSDGGPVHVLVPAPSPVLMIPVHVLVPAPGPWPHGSLDSASRILGLSLTDLRTQPHGSQDSDISAHGSQDSDISDLRSQNLRNSVQFTRPRSVISLRQTIGPYKGILPGSIQSP